MLKRLATAVLIGALAASSVMAGPAGRLRFGRPTGAITFSPSLGVAMENYSQAAYESAPGATETHFLTMSFWFWGNIKQPATKTTALFGTSIITSVGVPSGPNQQCEIGNANGTTTFAQGFCIVPGDNSPGQGFPLQFNTNSDGGIPPNGINGQWQNPVYNVGWNHAFADFDTVQRKGELYVNGTLVQTLTSTNIPSNMLFPFNYAGFGLGSRNTNLIYEWQADVYIDGTAALCSSTSPITIGGATYACPNGAGTTPPAYLAKFIDPSTKKAISLGSDGSLPMGGTKPLFFYTGNGSAMFTNQGSVGAAGNLTLSSAPITGLTFNNLVAITPSYGPGSASLGSGKAIEKWHLIDQTPTRGCSNLCLTADSYTAPLVLNDFLLIHAAYVSTGAMVNPTCPTGWTTVASGQDAFWPTSSVTCSHFYSSSDISGNITSWQIPLDANVSPLNAHWQLWNFGQTVASLDASASGAHVSTRGATSTTPNNSTNSANETLFLINDQGENGRTITTPPAGTALLTQLNQACNQASALALDAVVYNVTLGASTLYAFNYSASGCSAHTDTGIATVVALVPN